MEGSFLSSAWILVFNLTVFFCIYNLLNSGPDKRFIAEIRDGFDGFRVSWFQQVRFYVFEYLAERFNFDSLSMLHKYIIRNYKTRVPLKRALFPVF